MRRELASDEGLEGEIKALDGMYISTWASVLDVPEHEAMFRGVTARCCARLNGDEASRKLARSARRKMLHRYTAQLNGHVHYTTSDACCFLREYVGEERQEGARECARTVVFCKLAAEVVACVGKRCGVPTSRPFNARLTDEELAQTTAWG